MLRDPAAMRKIPLLIAFLAISVPASAQVDLTGSWAPRLYEDYIERGPGSDLGDFTGVPMSDEARAKALLYTSNLPSTVERQCLAAVALGRAIPSAWHLDLGGREPRRGGDRMEAWR